MTFLHTSLKRKRTNLLSFACASGLCLLILTADFASAQDPLEKYLTRLGLSDLRLHHLEKSLASAPADQQAAQARRLADLYAEQMLASADDATRFAALQAKIESLLAANDAANTPAVQIVLLQAEYQRAEALVIRWIDDPRDRQPLAAARDVLTRIAPELSSRLREMTEAAEAALKQIETEKTEEAKAAAEQESARLQALASRAAYFAGWSHYYLGLADRVMDAMAGGDMPDANFQAAKQAFLTVLDITDGDSYGSVEADGLALESLWRTRAVIGLGLSEIALGNLAPAAKVLAWLQHASVPTDLRDQAGYWHVQGLLNAGRYAEAAALVDQQVQSFSGSPSAGKNSLCIAPLRAAAALPADQVELRRKLIEPGIRGLARLRQFDTLAQTLAKFNLDALADPSSFYLTWLRGRQQFLTAEKTKAAAEYEAAAHTLQTALDHPQAKTELADAAQARYYWAWSQYRLGQLDVAASSFLEAVPALKAALPDLAVQSAWMQCVALQQLAVKDKKRVAPAMTAMQTLIADFPQSEQARKAEFALTRLRQASSSPEESIALLAAVPASDPNYVASLFEICQLRHQMWRKGNADPKKAAPLADAVIAAVQKLLAAAPESDHDRRLRAALLAIDVLPADGPGNPARIASYLALGEKHAAKVDPASTAAAEYQYRRLQTAQRTKDESAAREAAAWLVEHAGGGPYELPALVVAARDADRAVVDATAADRPKCVAAAAEIYTRLVAQLGDSPAVLAKTKNALAAASKLAEYDQELGRTKEAAARLARIVEAYPTDKNYLRRAGLAHFALADYPASLDCWRRLLGGVSSGSDEWLEAKYHQVASLLHTDRPAAEKVWRQFQLLYPEVKSPAWRDKFAELASQFQ